MRSSSSFTSRLKVLLSKSFSRLLRLIHSFQSSV